MWVVCAWRSARRGEVVARWVGGETGEGRAPESVFAGAGVVVGLGFPGFFGVPPSSSASWVRARAEVAVCADAKQEEDYRTDCEA